MQVSACYLFMNILDERRKWMVSKIGHGGNKIYPNATLAKLWGEIEWMLQFDG